MSSLNDFTPKKTTHLWPITLLRVYAGVVLAAVHAGRIHSLDAKLADRFRFLA